MPEMQCNEAVIDGSSEWATPSPRRAVGRDRPPGQLTNIRRLHEPFSPPPGHPPPHPSTSGGTITGNPSSSRPRRTTARRAASGHRNGTVTGPLRRGLSRAYGLGVELAEIRKYPVKSVSGHAVDSAVMEPWGLAEDRRWAVVNDQGDVHWLGENPRLLSVVATVTDEGGLLINAPGMPPLKVQPATGERVPITFAEVDDVVLANPEAHAWFTRLLGKPARLVWLDDPNRCAVPASHGGLPGDVVSLAGDAPVLLTSRSSLRRLDQWILDGATERREDPPAPLDMARFRPSLVIDGAPPYAEDGWREIRIGPITFRVSELCDRCAVTTYDPVTFQKGKEPLRTLARHRRWNGRTWFGVRLIPRSRGELHLGDPLTVLS
ncbi:MOSC domain-containing protein [Nonomuraea sp. NPDC050783]|uniref:MOSC domain-containing protein n=1 Tax=Nonomuraea sp. NPDC050783 TaxID=3154634 RepID=UPI0034678B3B